MKEKLQKFDEFSCRIFCLQSIFILLFVFSLNISNAQVSTYPIPPNAVISTEFQLSSGGQNIPVFKYMDYHYAHFSLAGMANFKVTSASGTITSSKISPLSLGITGTTAANELNFAITQSATTDETPKYLVLQINALEKLVILADKPEIGAPASSGTGIYNVMSAPYNADNTGVTYTQPAIQQAIDDASAAGGGTVYVPAGLYKVKENLSVKSNVTLYLAPGSVLKAIDIRSEYALEATIEPLLIVATGAINANIKGRGEIDASGFKLMDPPTGFSQQSVEHPRRRIVQIDNNQNVTFDGIILKDASGWSMDLRSSNNVICQNVKVLNHKNIARKIENDGIDMTSSSNSKVNQCFVITVDDAMCAKARYSDMDNVEFSNNVNFTSAAGIKAGMQSVGNMTNIVFRNNDVVFSYRGIGVDTKEGDLPINGVVFINNRIEESKNHCVDIMAADAPINNIQITNCNCLSNNHLRLYGAYDVKNVAFKGIVLQGNTINSLADANSYATLTKGENDSWTFGPDVQLVYEAELASITNGVIETGATGQYVNLEAAGKLVWNVKAGAAGISNIAFYLGVPTASIRSMGVYVNGTKIGAVSSNTIGYAKVVIAAELNQGDNTIELRDSEGTSEFNVDYLEIEPYTSEYQAENALFTNGTIKNGAILGEYNVDILANGDIKWTVKAETTAPHILTFKAKVPTAGNKSMGVYVNGNKVGVISSSSATFTEIFSIGSLNTGFNTIELKANEGTEGFNLDYLKISPSTSIFEAENAVYTNGALGSTAVGVTPEVKWIDLEGNGKIVWTIPVIEAKTYTLKFNVTAVSASNRRMGVFVNGTKIGVVGIVTADPAGIFSEKSISAALISGNNTIELRDTEGTTEFNVDYLSIPGLNSTTLSTEKVSSANDAAFFIYPNPSNGILNIELAGEKYDSMDIYTITGLLVYTKKLDTESSLTIDLKHVLKTGVYIVSIKSGKTVLTKKLIVR